MKMECAEIRELLSQYIDDMLDTQTKAFLDEHLSSCGDCREELLSLTVVVNELGSIDPVPAPSNFLNELNEKIKTKKSFTRLIRKLFMPLKIKLPMELATAALLAVLVFSVVNLVQEETPLEDRQFTKSADVITEKSEMDLAETTPVLKYGKPAPALEQKTVENRLFEDKDSAKKKGASKSIKRDIIKQKKIEEKLSIPKLALQTTPATGKGALSSQSDSDEEAYTPKNRAFRRAAPMASSLGAASREKEQAAAGLERAYAPMEKDELGPLIALSSVESTEIIKLIEAFDGKVVSLKYSDNQEKAKSLRAKLPTKHSKEFFDKLKRLAVFSAPVSTTVDGEREFFEVVIKFEH
jgi:hypothetical protein